MIQIKRSNLFFFTDKKNIFRNVMCCSWGGGWVSKYGYTNENRTNENAGGILLKVDNNETRWGCRLQASYGNNAGNAVIFCEVK